MKLPGFSFVGVLLLFLSCGPIFGQSYSQSVKGSYARILDISYVQIGAWDGRLDVYSRNDATGPQPTLIYFHGGGAVGADREKRPARTIFCLTSKWDGMWSTSNGESPA